MSRFIILNPLLLAAAIVTALVGRGHTAEPRVDLEVAIEGGFVPSDARAWTEMLSQAGFSNVRLRGDRGDSPGMETLGTEQSRSYKVIGILTAANQLVLPKGKFGVSDRGSVEAWLRKL